MHNLFILLYVDRKVYLPIKTSNYVVLFVCISNACSIYKIAVLESDSFYFIFLVYWLYDIPKTRYLNNTNDIHYLHYVFNDTSCILVKGQ